MSLDIPLKKQTFIGLFLICLATLMFEILLTRIFSVTMYYHLAFMAISLAMFGMTVGAMTVFRSESYFSRDKVKVRLVQFSLFFAASIVISFLIHANIPLSGEHSFWSTISLVVTYLTISVPFVCSGICVCMALTKFPKHVSKLYCSDLLGAASGCVALIVALKFVDGPSAVMISAGVVAVGAVFFSLDGTSRKMTQISVASVILIALLGLINLALDKKGMSLFHLKWVKGAPAESRIYEKWNTFSRVTVHGDPDKPEAPFSWGLSATYPADKKIKQLLLQIDAAAATPLLAFDGDFKAVDHLKYDVTNLVHYLRGDGKVLVVGVGGGRDILSALAFNQKSVLGIEYNPDILDVLNHRFGNFTGHLDQNPKVSFVNDEARSYIARQKDKYDIIQISLIDTWAATAAGAYVLTENSIYTTQAFEVFLKHLNPYGVLSVSRWYSPQTPGEMYRLTALAAASLKKVGIEDPRKHLLTVRQIPRPNAIDASKTPICVGTMLISPTVFSERDAIILENVTKEMQYEIVIGPKNSVSEMFEQLASGIEPRNFQTPLNLAPPTDDSPFFFNTLKFSSAFNLHFQKTEGANTQNAQAVTILGALLAVIFFMTFSTILRPLMAKNVRMKSNVLPFVIYFVGIGLGFMLVEISQTQRLIMFLGQPIYGLSVVLFTLLLSSGLGSYLTQEANKTGSGTMRLWILIAMLGLFGVISPMLIAHFRSYPTVTRILLAIVMLAPLGFFMGMAFPLGMKSAGRHHSQMTPWFWGINGAASVCASVLAVAIAMVFGINAAFWSGGICYLLAILSFLAFSKQS